MKQHKDQRFARVGALAAFGIFILLAVVFSAASARTHPAASLRPHPAASVRSHPIADDTSYTLLRTYKAGDVDRYSILIHTSIAIPNGDSGTIKIAVDMVMKETTKEIDPDGTVKLTDVFEKAIFDVGGHRADAISQLPHITQIRDGKGQVLDVKVEGGIIPPGPLHTLPRVLQSFYPPDSVKVGDSWKIDYTSPNSDAKTQETFKIVGTGKVVSMETVGGVGTLKVEITANTTYTTPDPLIQDKTNTVKGHIEGSANLDPKTGKMMRMSGKTDGDDGMGDISLKLKTDADKDDDKAASAQAGDAGKSKQKP